MKVHSLLLVLLALAMSAFAQNPAAEPPSARFPGDGFELRVYQDAEQAIPPSIFSIPGDGRHPDPPPGGAFRSSCNVFLVIEGDRRVLADPAAATNLPAGFVAEPGPGHTPCHVFYRKGTLLFVGDAFHAVDLQIFEPEYCAKWDQDPATAIATRRALIQRSYTNIPKPKPNRITPLTSPPIDHPPLFLCGAHIPFPGIVSKIHRPMASAHEAPSFDTPDPGTPIPAEPRPPDPPDAPVH